MSITAISRPSITSEGMESVTKGGLYLGSLSSASTTLARAGQSGMTTTDGYLDQFEGSASVIIGLCFYGLLINIASKCLYTSYNCYIIAERINNKTFVRSAGISNLIKNVRKIMRFAITMEKTTIQVSKPTLERLKMFRHGRESYDELLNKVFDEVEHETLSSEEIEGIKQGLEDIKAGRVFSIEQVARELRIKL